MPDINKPILITITVKPPKGAKRPITVSAAPEGEMPLLLTGQFVERHQLLDQVFAELLKRKPKVVKTASAHTKPAKKSQGPEKSQIPPKGEEYDEEPEKVSETPSPERKCRICGCTDAQACEGGCTWIGDDLCSNCEDKALEEIKVDQLVRSEGLPTIEGDEPADETQATLF